MIALVTACAVLSLTVWLYLVALHGGFGHGSQWKDRISPTPLEDDRTGR